MVVVSLLAGLGVFLWSMPASLAGAEPEGGLFERIDAEQFARYQQAFQQQAPSRRWPLLHRLLVNRERAERCARWVGVNWQQTERRLTRLRWRVTVEELVWVKLATGCLLFVALAGVSLATLFGHRPGAAGLTSVAAALVLFLSPTWLLQRADRRAQEEMQRQIPLFFSLIQSLVEAGLPVVTAIRSTARRFDGRLGRELARLDLEEKRYGNWRKALEEMAHRWEVDALIAVVSDLNDAMTKGVPVAGILADHVEEQMRLREDEALSDANRLAVRMLPIVIVFMGVPLLFLVMGPAFVGLKALF